MLLLLFTLMSLSASSTALTFTPSDHADEMGDNWLYRNPKTGEWLLNYLVKHHTTGAWNAVSSAVSTDGVHFADMGPVIWKDCASPDDCAVWLGSGSVWQDPLDDDAWIMNFSQQYDCDNTTETDFCQSIFFAKSTDLRSWAPLAPDAVKKGGAVFKYGSQYKVGGRWDCIAVIPRPEGGLYGYWTATPVNDTGGAGLGYTEDGVTWHTLATPGPPMKGEGGGAAQINGTTWMTFRGGAAFRAAAPTGPFVAPATNPSFLQGGGTTFPRLWGALYTGAEDLTLVTHHLKCAGGTVYSGLVKRAVVRADGALRAEWWDANLALKGSPLMVAPATTRAGGAVAGAEVAPIVSTPECVGICLTSGLWLDGSIKVGGDTRGGGIWLELHAGGGFGIVMDEAGVFELGTMAEPDGIYSNATTKVDRGPFLSEHPAAPVPFRLLARTQWDQKGALVEAFFDGVAALPFALPSPITGRFAALGGLGNVEAFRLTLPTQA